MTGRPMLDSITESSLVHLRSIPDEQAAIALDGRLRALEALWRRSFVERGLILIEMKQRLLWQHLDDPTTGVPYTSLERWILTAAPQSRADCYAAMRAVEELRDVPREQLAEIPRCNVHILQALSSQVRREPEVIKAATSLSQREFVAKLEKEYPLQHIESRRTLHMHPTKGASEVIEQAIQRASDMEGCTTREESLECIAVYYLQGHEAE